MVFITATIQDYGLKLSLRANLNDHTKPKRTRTYVNVLGALPS
jgi:hypothetical protein